MCRLHLKREMLPGLAYRYGRSPVNASPSSAGRPSKSPVSASSSGERISRSGKGKSRSNRRQHSQQGEAKEGRSRRDRPTSAGTEIQRGLEGLFGIQYEKRNASRVNSGSAYLRAKQKETERFREGTDAPSPSVAMEGALSNPDPDQLHSKGKEEEGALKQHKSRDGPYISSPRGKGQKKLKSRRSFFAERTPVGLHSSAGNYKVNRIAETRQMRASTFLAAFVRWTLENAEDLISGGQRLSLSTESLAYVLKKEHVPIAALGAEFKADNLGNLEIEKVLQFFETLRATAEVHLRPGGQRGRRERARSSSTPSPVKVDVSRFTNLRILVLDGVAMGSIVGLGAVAQGLFDLKVRNVDLGAPDPEAVLEAVQNEGDNNKDGSWARLKTLQLSNVGLESINGDSVDWTLAPNLSTLDLSSNRISSIADEGFIQSMEVFRPGTSAGSHAGELGVVPVPRKGGLQELHSLQVLDLSDNSIASMANANLVLGNLACLVLNNNTISSAEGLSKLYALRALHLRNNCIADWDQVAQLAKLPSLSKWNWPVTRYPARRRQPIASGASKRGFLPWKYQTRRKLCTLC